MLVERPHLYIFNREALVFCTIRPYDHYVSQFTTV